MHRFCRQIIVVLTLLLIPSSGCAQNTSIESALSTLESGDYKNARALLQPLVGSTADSSGLATVGFLESFLATGEYTAGIDAAASILASNGDSPFAHYMLGRLLRETGQLQRADAEFRRAAALKKNYWRNALSLGEQLLATGNRREALQIFATIANAYKLGYFKTAETLSIAGRSAAFVEEFRDANNAFNTAHQLAPRNTENLVWWGDLFREKYNNADAERTYREAIAVNGNLSGAYVGLAQTVGGFAAKEKLIDQAIAANPNNVEALSLRASLRLLDGQYDVAATVLNGALATNPTSVFALAHLAAVSHLQADTTGYRNTEERALAVNPNAADFFLVVAEDLALRFRYPAAAEMDRKAVELDSENSRALAALGTSLLRLGQASDARRYLERSFEKDPFNLFVGNTLTLLDEYEDFRTLEGPHVRVLIHKDEADVLGKEIVREAEAAFASMRARYPYDPTGKILIEAYNDKDDFAVRIAGVPHLGLLGVSFGDVVAINTPRAQSGSEYNWSRTLWHEIAHTMAIGLSANHVPRWFTEGLSVYEERLAHPEWGRELELELFTALDRDRLHSLENMDRGFTRPEFPGQVLLSYFHASKIIEYIADTHGFVAVVSILSSLADGQTMENAIQIATGVTQQSLDASLTATLRQQRAQFAHLLSNMPDPLAEDPGAALMDGSDSSANEFLTSLRAGYKSLLSGDLDTAETHFNKSLELHPTFVHKGNAFEGLASVYRQRGDVVKLESTLLSFLAVSDHGAREAVELAAIQAEKGEIRSAADNLERSLFVDPYDRDVRSELADLYGRLNDKEGAIRNRRAVISLNPVDRAEAFFKLADALYEAGQTGLAKRAALQSLELAPGYREAQLLLLKCVEG